MFCSGRFRIEHREHETVRVVGHITDTFAHHSALEVFIPGLLSEGAAGWAVMIDEASETVVARRRIQPFGPHQRPKAGPTGPRRRT